MQESFVFLSGENQSLGRNEVEALLEMRGGAPDISWFGRLGIFEGEESQTKFLRNRAAMIKHNGVVIAKVKEFAEGIEQIPKSVIESVIGADESFRIRTHSLGWKSNMKIRKELTTLLGDRIQDVTGANVSLDNPDVEFRLFLVKGMTIVCKSMKSILRRHLVRKQPQRLVSFHPSVMNALVARAMCNLAQLKKNEMMVDPYCGIGGILFEASQIGANVVGMDIEWLRLRGAVKNLSSLKNAKFNIIQGDAQFIPVRGCDKIITDPPYGRASSTYGAEAENLVSSLFEEIPKILAEDGKACVCSSSEMQLGELAEKRGLTIERKVSIRVHRSLTREIVVLKS
ncbi:MAG: THUMP domain-containing protein [Promethearchaeia archaeon]